MNCPYQWGNRTLFSSHSLASILTIYVSHKDSQVPTSFQIQDTTTIDSKSPVLQFAHTL
jgi:hypothetical protein